MDIRPHPQRRRVVAAVSAAATLAATLVAAPATPAIASPPSAAHPAYLDASRPIDQRVTDLLGRMTLPEKIGQMTQAERGAVINDPTLIAKWGLGSVLSGGGSTPAQNTPAAWVDMVNTFQAQALATRLQIPMIYGIDAVHGHGNALGATIFPHNVGMGATRDPALAEREGKAVAAEVRATGIPWTFGPCVCVVRDERWGRSYESFGEDPALVVSMSTVIDGFQGTTPGRIDSNRVLSTAKHFAGDGDTQYNTAVAASNVGKPWYQKQYTIDQGVDVTTHPDFARVALAPYGPAVRDHNVGAVMPSYSSVQWTDYGSSTPLKMHADQQLITGYLKQQLGFRGFLISDWEGIHQIPDPSNPTNTGLTPYKVRTGVNAGIDMFMEPNTAPQFEQMLLDEVNAGRVSVARINDAVSRILHKKFELGLFEHPYAPTGNTAEVGSAAHRAIARQAAAESQVLLKNSGNLLPLSPKTKLYVAGRNADDIGNQAGGWTITWQGQSGQNVIPGTTILQGIKQDAPGATVTYSADGSAPTAGSDVAVVVVGETPYSEGYGDVGGPECGFCTVPQQESKSLELQSADKAVVDKVCSAIKKCVVLVVSGRPQIVTGQLGEISSLVASWLPGSEGAGVADVLFGKKPFTGRLPVSWPRSADQEPINVGDPNYHPLYPFGWGLRTRVSHEAPLNASALATAKGDPQLIDEIVSRARDAAEANVVAGHAPSGWESLIANADHALLTGDPVTAFRLLMRAAA